MTIKMLSLQTHIKNIDKPVETRIFLNSDNSVSWHIPNVVDAHGSVDYERKFFYGDDAEIILNTYMNNRAIVVPALIDALWHKGSDQPRNSRFNRKARRQPDTQHSIASNFSRLKVIGAGILMYGVLPAYFAIVFAEGLIK